MWEWLDARLTEGLPGIDVLSELAGERPEPPALVWSFVAALADPVGAWEGTLTAVLLTTAGQAGQNIRRVASLIDGWATPGPLHDTQRLSLVGQRSNTNKTIRQFTFTYMIQWTI
jgi:hypothetical protein